MCWRVIGRCPTVVNMRLRGTCTLTGRFTFFAPMAASSECGQGKSFPPKPDPWKGEITRMRSSGIPSISDITCWWFTTPWLVSYIVILSPSHTAMVACISIGLWVSTGIS